MKKILTLLLCATMLLGMTSCLDSNDSDNNKQTLLATMYNRVVDGGSSTTYSSSTYSITLNYSNGTIQLSPSIVIDGANITFNTPEMQLNYNNSDNYYAFSTATFTSNSGVTVSNLNGQFDLSNGTLYVSYTIDGQRVFATAGLFYSKTITLCFNDSTPKDEYTTTASTYAFVIDNPTMTATLTISNFGLDNTIAARDQYITVKGIKIAPTASGYTLSADSVAGTLNNYEQEKFTFSGLEGTIGNDGTSLSLKCKVNGRNLQVSGSMFETATK